MRALLFPCLWIEVIDSWDRRFGRFPVLNATPIIISLIYSPTIVHISLPYPSFFSFPLFPLSSLDRIGVINVQ